MDQWKVLSQCGSVRALRMSFCLGLVAVAGVAKAAQDVSQGPWVGRHFLESTLTLSESGKGGDASDTYLVSDGTGWIRQAGRDAAPVPIRWFTQSDGQFCITRTQRGYPQAGECAVYSITGDQVEVRFSDGGVRTGAITPGDPGSLELQATGQTVDRKQGAVAVRALVDNTLTLTAIGARHPVGAYYLMSDGTMRRLEDLDSPGDYVGEVLVESMRWKIDAQDRLCIAWKRGEACDAVSVVGNRVVLRHGDAAWTGRLEAGDVWNLSPAGMRESRRIEQAISGASLVASEPGSGSAGGYYLGADGKGGEMVRAQGKWTLKNEIRWMFRPDRHLLCIRNTSRYRDEKPEFRTSNCSIVSLSGDTLTFERGQGRQARVRLVKGNHFTPR